MPRYRLIVQGRDTWDDARWESLELSSEGAISEVVELDPGNKGCLRITIIPHLAMSAKNRTRVLVNLAIAGFPSARWVKA